MQPTDLPFTLVIAFVLHACLHPQRALAVAVGPSSLQLLPQHCCCRKIGLTRTATTRPVHMISGDLPALHAACGLPACLPARLSALPGATTRHCWVCLHAASFTAACSQHWAFFN
jgi:hypothetical protein